MELWCFHSADRVDSFPRPALSIDSIAHRLLTHQTHGCVATGQTEWPMDNNVMQIRQVSSDSLDFLYENGWSFFVCASWVYRSSRMNIQTLSTVLIVDYYDAVFTNWTQVGHSTAKLFNLNLTDRSCCYCWFSQLIAKQKRIEILRESARAGPSWNDKIQFPSYRPSDCDPHTKQRRALLAWV